MPSLRTTLSATSRDLNIASCELRNWNPPYAAAPPSLVKLWYCRIWLPGGLIWIVVVDLYTGTVSVVARKLETRRISTTEMTTHLRLTTERHSSRRSMVSSSAIAPELGSYGTS